MTWKDHFVGGEDCTLGMAFAIANLCLLCVYILLDLEKRFTNIECGRHDRRVCVAGCQKHKRNNRSNAVMIMYA